MATRTQQYQDRRDFANTYETFLKSNSAAMSWVPWTKAWSWAPALQYEITKPFLYSGFNSWSQKTLGTTSKQGVTVGSEKSGIKYGLETNQDVNTDLVLGGVEKNELKTSTDDILKDFNLINDLTAIAGSAYSSASTYINSAKTAQTGLNAAKTAAEVTKEAKNATKVAQQTGTWLPKVEIASQVGIQKNVPTVASKPNFFNTMFDNISKIFKNDTRSSMYEGAYDVVKKLPEDRNAFTKINGLAKTNNIGSIENIENTYTMMQSLKKDISDVKGAINDYKNINDKEQYKGYSDDDIIKASNMILNKNIAQ